MFKFLEINLSPLFCIMRYGFSHSRVVYTVPSTLFLLLNEIHVNACSQKKIHPLLGLGPLGSWSHCFLHGFGLWAMLNFLGKLSPSSVVFSFFYLLGCFSLPQVFLAPAVREMHPMTCCLCLPFNQSI
jgi:hypothetical protein